MALSGPGEFVHLENLGTEPLHYRYHGSNHSLPPGKVIVVPWGHMDHLMGNPYLVDIDRSERLDQILKRYGCRRIEELPYTLKATDAEGDPITTIVDDPDGRYALSAGLSDSLDPTAVQAAMRSMERQLAIMQAQLDAQAAVPAEDQTAEPDAAPQEVAAATARERALARATGGVTDNDDIISTVAPHLVPSTDVPVDGPMTDTPTRVPSA